MAHRGGTHSGEAMRGEAFPREGGGNWAGRHRRAAGPAERPRPSGETESGRLGKEKGSGSRLGRKPKLGPIQVIKPF
jgi:hypothetical protein